MSITATSPDGFVGSTPETQPVLEHRIAADRYQTFLVEYMGSVDDLIVHLYRRVRGTPWPEVFPYRIWDCMIESYHLGDPMNELRVEWIPEFHGWCLTLFGLARGGLPDETFLTRALDKVEQCIPQS